MVSANKIAWIAIALTAGTLFVKTVVEVVRTQQQVEELTKQVVVLRDEIRVIHEDVKGILKE